MQSVLSQIRFIKVGIICYLIILLGMCGCASFRGTLLKSRLEKKAGVPSGSHGFDYTIFFSFIPKEKMILVTLQYGEIPLEEQQRLQMQVHMMADLQYAWICAEGCLSNSKSVARRRRFELIGNGFGDETMFMQMVHRMREPERALELKLNESEADSEAVVE